MDKIKQNKSVRCPKCNSTQTYFRRKKQDYVCIKCSTVFNDADLEKVNNKK